MGVKNKIVKISVVRKYPKSWRADIGWGFVVCKRKSRGINPLLYLCIIHPE